jgi:hypothetical protein
MNHSPGDIYFLKIANEIQHHEFRMITYTEELMATWPRGTRTYEEDMPDYEFDSRKEYIEETAFCLLDIRQAITNSPKYGISDAQRKDAIASVAIGATRLMYRDASAAAARI